MSLVEVDEGPSEDVIMIAKTVWGEARGCSTAEQRLVAWCILNRLDNGSWGDTVEEVLTYPNAFAGYSATNPVTDECVAIVEEVMLAWSIGAESEVLAPYATESGYLYFNGKNGHNWFRKEY